MVHNSKHIIASDSSNAPTPTPTRSTPIPQRVTDPNAVVSTQTQTTTPLVFPSDRPKYFLRMDIMQYSRKNLLELGTLSQATGPTYKDGNSIILPLAQSLDNLHSARWDDRSIGFGVGAAVNAGAEALRGNGRLPNMGDIAGLGTGTFLGAIPGAQAILGMAPNQFMSVLYIGPEYKRHQFNWSLSPNNFQEADTIRKIVRTIQNSMSPNVTAGGLIFTFPKIFNISLMPNSKWLYKFKPCVLEKFDVNYTPGGRASFHTGEENPPTGVNIKMQFVELEFWIEGNHTDSNDPRDVYTTAPNAAAEDFANSIRDRITSLTNWQQSIQQEINRLLGLEKKETPPPTTNGP